METYVTEGLRINCPEWFQRADFKAWLNNSDNKHFTWHTKGTEPSEWSDTIVLVDPSLNGEGSDQDAQDKPDGLPVDIWNDIVKACVDSGLGRVQEHIPVRLCNI